jgi:TolB-like protein/DNA-binding winged helix-turn-helix (wHTH) protein/Tfp pilus assembly protein PilF
MVVVKQPSLFRFGVFELDTERNELRKSGLKVKLHDQSFSVLLVLLERPGRTVERKEIQQRLWPDDTFVEFENGLNNVISRLREALGDSPHSPRFIETLPRHGYRFVAPVELVQPGTGESMAPPPEKTASVANPRRRLLLAGGIAMIAAAAVLAYTVATRTASPAHHAIAVLPFATATSAKESADEYMAFGMTEALTTELSRAGTLKVISQTSALQYKNTRKPLPLVARELGVRSVVEGSVVREGDQVRFTIQLIDATNDTHLWAQHYSRDAQVALSGQRELARDVAAQIRARLLPSDQTSPPPFRQTNPQAYEAFVKGRFFLQRSDEASGKRAREFFEQSIAADPSFAPAYVGLAHYFVTTDAVPPDIALAKTRENARQALKLDETSAGAHAALGFAAYWEWDWSTADREFKRALELDPNHALARRWCALYLSSMGRHEAAIREIQVAQELDPASISALDAAGAIWLNARRFDKVFEQGQRIHELSSEDSRGHMYFATSYLHQGKFVQAVEAAQKGVALSQGQPLDLLILAQAQKSAGQVEDARRTLNRLKEMGAAGYVSDALLATASWSLGEREAAIQHLQRGIERRDSYLALLKVAPMFDDMRSDARFQEMVEHMNFPK